MAEKVSYSLRLKDKEYLDDPPQPRPEDPIPRVSGCRVYRDVRYFPPVVPDDVDVDILFVQVAPLPEEASSVTVTPHQHEIPRKPGLGSGPAAQIIKEATNRFPDLHSSRVGFASLVPWLLPKTGRWRPKKEVLEKVTPWIRSQVESIKPKCVVAMGLQAFKALTDLKIAQDDARYGWFSTAVGKIPLYLSIPTKNLVTQPWTEDTLITDLKEVSRFLSLQEGGKSSEQELNIRVVSTMDALQELVDLWKENDITRFSVDCEWGRGMTHVTGELRSIQFAWGPDTGAYLRFYDEHGNYHLGARQYKNDLGEDTYGVDYAAVGKVLNQHLERPDVTYIGHHFTADSPWMSEVLKIPVRGRCVLDTEYALQTVDEYAPRGLEALALRFTNFGRYDLDLVMWKKDNPGATKDGYDKIPDGLLIRYAVIDTLVVWQAADSLERRMRLEEVWNYYRSILNPFVTDVFHDFVVMGLPVNMEIFEGVRKFMNWAYKVLYSDLIEALKDQADSLAAEKLGVTADVAKATRGQVASLDCNTAAARLKPLYRGEGELKDQPWFLHWIDIENFNIRSSPHMRRWLFGFMGFTPVKTTAGGADGIPSMLWERALELPEKVFKTLNPAVDKETLEILEQKDESGLITRLLAVSNVGNQCKGFLKEGDIDEGTGETVQENGLAKFIGEDHKIHGQFSLTETGRPRSWSPNLLNLSSYHNKGVEAGLTRVLNSNPELEIPAECIPILGSRQQIEEEVVKFLEGPKGASYFAEDPSRTEADARREVMKNIVKKRVPTVRSVVCAEPGYCFVESDYKTAEIRGLAFIFGDRTLIKFMTEPDPAWALTADDKKPVRLYYDEACGIPSERRNTEWEMKVVTDSKVIRTVTEKDLLRDQDGNIVHPPYDLHWSLAELVYQTPREELSPKRDRGAAKIANFSCVPQCLILQESGVKNLCRLQLDERVWDGQEFVRHEGLIYRGIRLTIEHEGLRATPDHELFIGEGRRFRLLEVALRGFKGFSGDAPVAGSPGDSDHAVKTEDFSVNFGKNLLEVHPESFHEGDVSPTDSGIQGFRGGIPSAGEVRRALSTFRDRSGEFSRFVDTFLERSEFPAELDIARLEAAGLKPRLDPVFDISDCGPRNRFAVLVPDEDLVLSSPHDQQGSKPGREEFTRGSAADDSSRVCEGGEEVGLQLQSQDGHELPQAESQSGGVEASERLRGYRQFVVSNCAYGAVASTIERRIEAVTGEKPAEGMGEALLEALERRQPEVFRGLEEVARAPERGDKLVAASGRVRRFPTHPSTLGGISWRVRKSYLRAMGNEARNFFPQESVAATLARACTWLNSWYRGEGLKARAVIGLYDSVLTYCPEEERHVCAEAHEVFMQRINFWKYGRRYMNYPIDTDFVDRWSYGCSDERQELLDDPNWKVLPKEKSEAILNRLHEKEKRIFKAQPWVLENLNKV